MKQAMGTMWKKGANDYESSARVVDGNLILSLPDAINPIVWRMELGSVKASALEVRKHATDGTHLLILKTPKGDVHDIAPFETRDGAVTALMRVTDALQGAQGNLAPASVAYVPSAAAPRVVDAPRPVFSRPDASALKWLLALAGVLAVIFLFSYLAGQQGPVTTAAVPGEETATSVTGEPSTGSGVPQSADDVLKGY